MKSITLLLIPLFLISCSGSKMLLKNLNKNQATLAYLHDSKPVDCDRSAGIALEKFSDQALDSATAVTKINTKILPFIVYNYTEKNWSVELGKSSLTQSYSDFFKESFTVESQRTGCYLLTNEHEEPAYALEITCDTCEVKSKYQSNSTVLFLLFAYSMYFQEVGSPTETDLTLDVKLRKSDNLIFEKKYTVDRTQPFLNAQSRDINKLRSDFITNMGESLSLSTKDCIEKIITDINRVIGLQ